MQAPSRQEQDLQCMERLRNGDHLALNELMNRWKEPLVTFCLRYTGNLTDAREIAQETFVKVHAARHRYRPKAAFSTWLFTIAANLCRMRARWRSRHPEILECDRLATGDDHPPPALDPLDPGIQSDRRALAQDLDQAIRNLPHDLRVPFILYELEGHPYRHLAETLRCSEKAVERRLAKARARLRVILEEKWRHQ